MPTQERTSKYFLVCVAMFFIQICVMNSNGPPDISDMFVQYSKRQLYLDYVRHKRDASTKANKTTTPAPLAMNSTTTKSKLAAPANSPTTKSKISPTTKSKISPPSNSSTTKSKISTTTKSTTSAFSNPTTTNLTTQINKETTETKVITFSLKISEDYDFELKNPSSEKYKKYKKIIEASINKGYNIVSEFKTNSATVTGFRAGSVIADFDISATTDNLNLVSANQQVIASLREQGFNISDDAFSRTVKDGLYGSTSQIYPENNLILTCTTTNSSRTWTKDGIKLEPSDKYQINSTSLTVKNTTPDDTGVYECRTTENFMPYIIWQRFMIPEPDIQVNSSKVITCGNPDVRLQCCVMQSYSVTWLTDPNGICGEPVQKDGCISCTYTVNAYECQTGGKKVMVRCKLRDSNYFKSFSINAVNREFHCKDNSSFNAFGAGDLGEDRTGDCNEDRIGYRIARCEAPGYWIVKYDNCVLRNIQYLQDRSRNLLVTDLPEFLANLSKAAESQASEIAKSTATILTIVELLKTIADLSQSVIVNKNIMTDYLKTLDVIGTNEAQGAWLDLNQNITTMAKSSELLNSTEKIVLRLQNESFIIITNFTSLQKYDNVSNSFNRTFGKNTTQIIIPTINAQISITVIISSTFNNTLPIRTKTSNDSSHNGTTINGDVAMVQINDTINNIFFSFAIKNKTLGNPQCVFWNFSLHNGVGGWDTNGCQLKPLGNNSERYTCECNHTTSFSILMSPVLPENCESAAIITYIGVGISMGSLVLCLIIEFIIWKSVTRNDTSYMRHVSIVNIAVSLLIANICFIIGAAVIKQDEGDCITATFFMHFFYLSLFFWMLLSGLFLLYSVLTMVHNIRRGAMMGIAFSVGYGAPLLIAVITVASTAGRNGYIQKDYNCWLNWNETKALLAFVVPALTIVAINLLVLVVVLCKMLRRGVNASHHPDEKHALLVIARCVAILTPLFGLTWGFGIGTMVSSKCGVHVVFALLNSLQGFFILLFGTLLDRKVREALARKIAMTSSSTQTWSTSVGSSSGGFPFIKRIRKRNSHNISEGRLISQPSSN